MTIPIEVEVLLVDDNPRDAELTIRELKKRVEELEKHGRESQS